MCCGLGVTQAKTGYFRKCLVVRSRCGKACYFSAVQYRGANKGAYRDSGRLFYQNYTDGDDVADDPWRTREMFTAFGAP